MRRIVIHRSLHRADLIMGIERDLLLAMFPLIVENYPMIPIF